MTEYIVDYISGTKVKATPEEIDAVQIFSKQLVEDYGYPKSNIQTRPQFRVKIRPSDTKKEYPVDIAIFPNNKKQEDEIYIIVECKKKNRKDGKTQLQDYLRFSKAYLGVWFNGDERLFLRKIEKAGKIEFEEIPNIPKFGQRVEDIGKFKRKDLKPTHNLKATFKAIRNHLFANTIGATRDEVLAQQLINLIFCKIYDERFTEPNDVVTFRAGIDEDSNFIKKRILDLFDKVKRKYKEVLDDSDTITLDSNSVAYVVGELQNYCLIEAERDIIADAFETFIGHALKGGQGQFFTPRNVVKMMVDILDPDDEDLIIDPACGSGGFLIESLRHVWKKLDAEGEKYHWNKNNLQEEKMEVALNRIRGIDKDYFLSKVAKAYMAIIGDGKSGIFCEDSLENPNNWNTTTKTKVHLGDFSILLTNPPFGSKIPVRGEDKLKQFELGHKWKLNGKWERGKLKDKEAPQILFIERCLQLLKDGGKMAIVLPDGIYGNESLGYVRQYILEHTKISAIIDVPLETFMPNTSTKTTILVLEKMAITKIPKDYPIFMSVIENCGHDRRGKENDIDEIKEVSNEYKQWIKDPKKYKSKEHYFSIYFSQIKDYDLWIPKYLFPRYILPIQNLKSKGIVTITLGELFDFKKGVEIGSDNYIEYIFKKETDVPFIRTSDLVNYTINRTADLYLSKEMFNQTNFEIKEKDILFTKDGKIGMFAIASNNTNFLISSGILRCRLKKSSIAMIKEKYNLNITPEYIFSVLITKEIGLYQSLRRTVIASTIPHLNLERLKDIEIPLFDQKTITDSTKKINDILELDNKKINLVEDTNKLFKY